MQLSHIRCSKAYQTKKHILCIASDCVKKNLASSYNQRNTKNRRKKFAINSTEQSNSKAVHN